MKKVLFIFGILLSIVAGGAVAAAQHYTGAVVNLINFDNQEGLSDVDVSKYNTVRNNAIINILLIGTDKDEDEQDSKTAARRTDSIMIATLDKKHDKLKISSIMRDCYVEIPGYGKNKINAAYRLGGIKLLYKTIASNFGIQCDGYCEVNFDAFINVVDAVGGVEATLTDSEAENLNDTNYIRRKKYRNVKKGTQILNGYQALGYCRIRHGKTRNGVTPAVYTADGKCDDYGRTERQRLVMQALLKKLKSMPSARWMEVLETVMPSVTTDIKKKEIYSYVLTIVKMGTTKINQFRVPVDGSFNNADTSVGSVLDLDLTRNKTELNKFIYNS